MAKRYWNELTFSENAIEWIRGENRVTCTFCSGGRLNNRPPRQMSEEERARAAENLRRNLDNFRGKSGQKQLETC